MNVAVCADVGSTYTKAAVVDLDGGRLVGAACAPPPLGADVEQGRGA
ncbi:glutamate mutase L, partial [Micromonospora sediminicola]